MKSTHGNGKSYSMCVVSGEEKEEIERLRIQLIQNDTKEKTKLVVTLKVIQESCRKTKKGVNKDELRTSLEKDKRNVSFQLNKG